MGHKGVKSGDVVETELTKCALQDFDTSLFRRLVGRRRVYGLHDLVNLGGHERVRQLEKVQLEHAGHNRDLISLKDLLIVNLAVVQFIAEPVRGGQGNIIEPNGTSSLVAFQFRIACEIPLIPTAQ
jgi:hypothetical protein